MACYIYKHPDHANPLVHKIGKANDVDQRHANLSTSYLNEITERWYLYPTGDCEYSSGYLYFIEHTIHQYKKDIRIRKEKEFFSISDVDALLIELIANLKTLGIAVKSTRNVADFKTIHDYSLDDDEEWAKLTKKIVVEPIDMPYRPKTHQLEILKCIETWYTSDKTAGKLILPPGTGKSYITSFWLRDLPETTKVLVFVPLRSIKEDFETALQRCGVNCPVDVMVNNTGWQGVDGEYDIIVYDEAHHMCSPQNSELLHIPAKKKLFLTATEKIIDDDGNPFDMNDSKFGDYIYQMGILDAIKKRLLVDYKIFLADWNLALKNLIEQLKNDYHRKKIIMFFNTIESATRECCKLNNLGFLASIITGETSMADRRAIINQFESNDFHIICNVGCIGEGVNIPCIDTVMFMESRTSNIGVIQNIGRGLRTHPGKDFCMIIVKEEMLDCKFIETLLVYDTRMSASAKMIISRPDKTESKSNLGVSYSIDGIAKLIEKFTSRGLSATDAFIANLRRLGILSDTEYKKRWTEFAGFPEIPEEKYPGFTWDNVPLCENPYERDECINKIAELAEIHRGDLAKIGSHKDKLVHLHKIDKRIDPRLFEEIRDDKKIKWLFMRLIVRRCIK